MGATLVEAPRGTQSGGPIRGAHWEPLPAEAEGVRDGLTRCAWCEAELHDDHVALIRYRGEHRIPDGFCGVAHLLEWAKAGGRYRP